MSYSMCSIKTEVSDCRSTAKFAQFYSGSLIFEIE